MTATETTALEAVLRRDRAVVVTALVAVITIAWIWILLGAGTGMTALDMARGSGTPGLPLTPEHMLELLRRGSSAPRHKVSRR